MNTLCREHVEACFETTLGARPALVFCNGGPLPNTVQSEPKVKGPAACICSIENVRPMDHGRLIVTKAGSLKHMKPVDLFKANHQIGDRHANVTTACCLAMK